MVFTAFPHLTVENFAIACISDRLTEFTRTQEMLGESLLIEIQIPNELLYIDIQMRGM